jgi:pimeloyl-ACP methyl ester carboxylesterase
MNKGDTMSLKPFTLSIPQAEIDNLQQRVKSARLPQIVEGVSWERGVPVSYLKKLSDYWSESFDWRKQEAQINKYEQFTTEIDEQTIHFFHVRSANESAMPLLLLHGWPSSSVEYLKVIDLLTKPKSGKAFHVIAPTIPGFGLSSPVTKTGWQSLHTAKAYAELMKQLGYEHYGVHGSDIGADILGELVKADAAHIVGTHFATDTSTVVYSVTAFMGGGDPLQNPVLSEAEKEQVKLVQEGWKEGDGYLKIQSTRPSTLAFGLNDSPVGQLAWQVEKYKIWTNPSDELPEKKIDIDQMLANISLYWFTGSGAASANYIYENYHAVRDWGAAPAKIPQGFAVFNAQSCARPLMDPEHKVAHWSEFKEGQHFPAMEVPELFAGDVQKFFASLQ